MLTTAMIKFIIIFLLSAISCWAAISF